MCLSPFARRLLPALALVVLWASPSRADEAPKSKAVTLAHMKLSGSMEEKAPTFDPLLGTVGETFKGKIDRLKKAASDKNIDAVVLEINGLSIGMGKLDELTGAVAALRKSGKKVFAHVESGATKDYLLALACDEVCLPPVGMLMLTGMRVEVTFYKGLFEKLGVKADFIPLGDFKAAAEPFTRDSLSEANRKQLTSILDDHFDKGLVGRIVAARASRKWTAEKVKKLIDEGPYSAKGALKLGLVDRLDYFDDYTSTAIKKTLNASSVKLIKDYGKPKDQELDLFTLMRKLMFGSSAKAKSSAASKVAIIYATGSINTGKSTMSPLGGSVMGSDTIVEAIKEAEKDKTVKAIVLRVDSGGGSALASDLIWKALKDCKKPVIASMSDVAGSGGYYICMSAKKIYAEPGTITGSIGVISGKLALAGLYNKAGIKTEVLSRGANSGILSSGDPFTAKERTAMKTLMQDVYDDFLDKALAGRVKAGKKMTRAELVKLAGGRIYTGRQAKALGLIDEVGTLEDAIADAAKLGGLPAGKDPELLMLPKSKGMIEDLLGSFTGLSAQASLASKVPGLREKLRGIEGLLELRTERVWAAMPFKIEVK